MSIIDAFNTSEQIIDPSAVARPIEGFPDTVLVTFSQKVLEAAAKRFKLTLLKEMHCCYTVPVYAFEYKGRKLGIYMTCLGGSAAAGLAGGNICRRSKARAVLRLLRGAG